MMRQYPSSPMHHDAWWHQHGFKLRIIEDLSHDLVLASNAARLTVTKYSRKEWQLTWTIRHSPEEVDSGARLLTNRQLKAAFGLDSLVGDESRWLVDLYGATSAVQGCFIRNNRWLNIPGPGTGHDGDPNISVYLDDETRNAVRCLLETHGDHDEI